MCGSASDSSLSTRQAAADAETTICEGAEGYALLMSITQVGYAGLAWSLVAASTATQNIGMAVGVVIILVSLSTLMIRFTSVVEKIVRHVINKMQVDGDLATKLERDEILKAVVTLMEHNEREDEQS